MTSVGFTIHHRRHHSQPRINSDFNSSAPSSTHLTSTMNPDLTSTLSPSRETDLFFLRHALNLAQSSPPQPTNFRVGALLVSFPTPASPSSTTPSPQILSTGYTLELPGNTHAEQCCLLKLASAHSISESSLHTVLPPSLNVTLYTSLEPCGKRLSGNAPCVQRIIETRRKAGEGRVSGIQRVVFGAKEPGTFVKDSQSCRLLSQAGVEWEYVRELEGEILEVAMAGHVKKTTPAGGRGGEGEREGQGETARMKVGEDGNGARGTRMDLEDITTEERARQDALPRNPKKRMMEVDVKPGDPS